ncbi:ABC transporter substrate-binding protein [Paraburkholderia caribensis]|uniref:ABC transporter substrate-binding protein n=1 Tax=Paraburkholderia TaxID=1822464 RepID=UPI001CB66E39|nr:ABC transporter substrate-binding protein [Paraburkholderia caribensis]BEU25633.1 ABC transporter substrate-binding protein [Paraburkholderia sp. 22B1P]CAG9262467.1 Nitrate ABC transporter substrate-binding protein [Paraburkholderia caribensis]
MINSKVLRLALICICAAASTHGYAEAVRISYQPANYWALPLYIASEKGWWKEAGLEPTFSTFPAGPQQIAALPSKSWDVAVTGSPPAVLGAVRFGLQTIALADDQSYTAGLVARAGEANAILANPSQLVGKDILLTTNSTGEYTAIACLKKLGLAPATLKVVNLSPAQTIAAYASGNGKLASAWPPFVYTLQEKADAKVICTGRDGGAAITAVVTARADYAESSPGVVAKVLAVYLRSVAWQKAHRAETMAYMKKFYVEGGTKLSDQFIAVDYDKRPIFTLDEQLKLFDRSAGSSTVDKWHTDLADYMKGTGTLAQTPDAKSYITDKYLKMVSDDPKLRMFATSSK